MALIPEATLKKIIVDGDSAALVAAAEEVGHALAAQYRLTTSQVRGIFGTVRQIEMDWLTSNQRDDANDQEKESRKQREQRAKRELLLLKPRIAYQAGRERGKGVSELSQVLTPAINMIGDDRQRFQNFMDFFEAILAYHRANGGRDS